jgi:hypothetical protein
MGQGRLRRIAAALVFVSVAVGGGETAAIGLELPAVSSPGPTTPSLPKLPSPSAPAAIPQAPSLPKLPSSSTDVSVAPLLSGAPSLPSPPSAPAPAGEIRLPGGSASLPSPRSSSTVTARGPSGMAAMPGSSQLPASRVDHAKKAGGYGLASNLAGLSRRGRDRARARERRKDARRLRAILSKLEGCFYALSRLERRVLVLRAGLDGRRPHSRSGVAKRLNISRKGVRRTERRGLRRLRRAARSDGCAVRARASGAGDVPLGGFIGPVAALEPVASRTAASIGAPAPSEFLRRGEAAEPAPSSPFPNLDGGGSGASGWLVVGASWAVAMLAVLSLVGLNRLLRLRRQK